MTRNVTLRIDDATLRKARARAAEDDLSLSQWTTELIARAVASDGNFTAAKRRALRRLEMGLNLGGKPLSREAAHER